MKKKKLKKFFLKNFFLKKFFWKKNFEFFWIFFKNWKKLFRNFFWNLKKKIIVKIFFWKIIFLIFFLNFFSKINFKIVNLLEFQMQQSYLTKL